MSDSVATIEIPQELLARIDEEVGAEGRTAFATRAMEAALRNQKLTAFLDDMKENGPAWKEEDHPELKDGAYAWVRKIRDEGEKRMKAAEDAWQSE